MNVFSWEPILCVFERVSGMMSPVLFDWLKLLFGPVGTWQSTWCHTTNVALKKNITTPCFYCSIKHHQNKRSHTNGNTIKHCKTVHCSAFLTEAPPVCNMDQQLKKFTGSHLIFPQFSSFRRLTSSQFEFKKYHPPQRSDPQPHIRCNKFSLFLRKTDVINVTSQQPRLRRGPQRFRTYLAAPC